MEFSFFSRKKARLVWLCLGGEEGEITWSSTRGSRLFIRVLNLNNVLCLKGVLFGV